MGHNSPVMSAPDSVPEELRELRPPFQPASSAPLPRADDAHYDELLGLRARAVAGPAAPDTPLAPAWARFFQAMGPHDGAQLDQRAKRLARQLRENGVSYNVYTDDVRLQRPWALDLFPVLITPEDWAHIEAGVLQRVRVLETVMADAYGERRLLREGLVPPALVQGHPDYLRALHGVAPVGGQHLHIVAMDLARGPNGHWWVVSQRTQAPSGLGYLLENRLAVSSQFPEAFDALHVRRLAAPYRDFIEGVKARSPAGPDAHVALLTAGPYNETYFEQSYLARYLGVTLVEGTDLTVRGERLFLKTLHGLRPVDALIKRVDDAWVDPLEMRPDSRLGVPGLVQAVRAGNVLMANALGSGFLESSALLGFLPAISEHLLGEPLRLPSLATWWCGEEAALREVLPLLPTSVIRPTYPNARMDTVMGRSLDERALNEWAGRIARHPEDYTVQAWLPLSQTPTWTPDGLVPRSAILRVFALADGPQSWRVLPGGLVRLAPRGELVAAMQRGGSSADCWVLTDGAVDRTTMLNPATGVPTQAQPKRPVTSRAAENLFWLGRYTERAENSVRMAQLVLRQLSGDEPGARPLVAWLSALARENALVLPDVPGAEQSPRVFTRSLIAALAPAPGTPLAEQSYSVGFNLRALKSAAAQVRERLSQEHWNLIKRTEGDFARDCAALSGNAEYATAEALVALQNASELLAAITGAQTDRMVRDSGWRLLSIGRHIERLVTLARALMLGLEQRSLQDIDGFEAMVALFDSTITFHARYQQRRDMAALLDLLVLDRDNPRSLAWVLHSLRARLLRLAENTSPADTALALALPQPETWQLATLAQPGSERNFGALHTLLADCIGAAGTLSDEITRLHFSHADRPSQSLEI